jgi:hypothetical protein
MEQETIAKKVCANEVMKVRKTLKLALIIGMGISFLGVASFKIFGFMAGAICVVLGLGTMAYIANLNEKEIKRLTATYCEVEDLQK